MIIVFVDCGIHGVLRILHILLGDELFPNADNFGEKTACLLYRLLLPKEFSHVVVAAAKVDALWAMLLALKENALGELLKGLFMGFWLVLGQKKSTEKFVNVCSILLDFLLADKSIVGASRTLLGLLRGVLEKIPVGCDEELFSLLQPGATMADVGLSEHEVSR